MRARACVQGGPSWPVPTGRRDGTVSVKQEALDQIPAPTMNFTQLLQSFHNKSLNLADLVWLSGILHLPADVLQGPVFVNGFFSHDNVYSTYRMLVI
jgi:hypothetical protein